MKTRIYSLLISATFGLAAFASPAEDAPLKENITDNNIFYPESFETNTQKLLDSWYFKDYGDLSNNVKSRSNNKTPDSVYIRRLKNMPTEIEMPYNQVVKSFILMYTEKRRELVEMMLGKSIYYNHIFEEALEREGLPLELKYLPVVESALNPNAVSRAGAAGLWQFMIKTAKGMGLEVNSLVDQRRDPYLSSDAAAKYLKELFNIYEDWSLAIAAYNCGPGNVNKAIRRSGCEKNIDFWTIYEFLPRETRGYVPAFIAANYIMTYYGEHGINPPLKKESLVVDSVHINTRIHLKQISEVLNIPIEKIRDLNPQYRKDIIPGNIHNYSLTLPSIQTQCFILSKDSIITHDQKLYAQRGVVEPGGNEESTISGDKTTTRKLVVKRYKVRRGDVISKVARKYGVTQAQIKKWNGLKSNTIYKGQILKIKTYITTYEPANKNKVNKKQTAQNNKSSQKYTNKKDKNKKDKNRNNKKNGQKYKIHTVKKGESLWVIASKYPGVTDKDIKRANNLRNSRIDVGDKLKIPVK